MSRLALRLPLVLFVALTLHHSLFASARLGDVRADLMLLSAVAAGVAGGPERGAIVGFAAGVVADLFVHSPLGLSALAFSLVGFAVGVLHTSVIRQAWWIAPLTACAASFVGVVLYGVLGAVLGQAHLFQVQLLVVAAGVAAANTVVALPVMKAVAWAVPEARERALA